MARRKNIVVERYDKEVLNDIRDTERRVFERLQPQALRELEQRGRKHQGPSGTYNDSFYTEVGDKFIGLKMGNSAPHAHLVEFRTEERYTKSGAYRGVSPRFGVIRKSALAIRRKVFSAVQEALRRV